VLKTVQVEKRKWPRPGGPDPDVRSTWSAQELGADAMGTWLFCPQGAPHCRADGSLVFEMPTDCVQLMPASGWWTAWWWAQEMVITVDICTPPAHAGGGWSYVDLEIDVIRRPDGTILVVDQHSLDGQRRSTLPADVIESVARETPKLHRMLASTVSETGWDWLSRAERQ
jgi:hypothetical protein